MSLTDKYSDLSKTGLRLAARLEKLGLRLTYIPPAGFHIYTLSAKGLDYDIQINGHTPSYGSVAVFPSLSVTATYGPLTISMFLKRIKSVHNVDELKDLLKAAHAIHRALREDDEDE